MQRKAIGSNRSPVKKVLFLSPNFFNYEQDIIAQLQSKGIDVTYFNERPSNSGFIKALLRLKIPFISRIISTRYYQGIIDSIKNKTFDLVVFISPESVSPSMLQKMQIIIPDAPFILYMWDSLKNKKGMAAVTPFFDKIYSFDSSDVEESTEVSFLPLFYTDKYQLPHSGAINYEYDIAFIGTVHSDRYSLIEQLKKQPGLNVFSYLYSPSLLHFFYQKITNPHLKGLKLSDVNFVPLSHSEIIDLYSKSLSILDIEHIDQSGLTMRTFEVFGCNKKLITTNKAILESPIYCESNHYYLDRSEAFVPQKFLVSQFQEPSEKLYHSFSLQSWVRQVFQL